MNGIWIKRFLALVGAVALVVGAVMVRRSWDDEGGGGSSPDTTDRAPGGDIIVACLADLNEWCDLLDIDGVTVRVEPWTTTTGSLAGPDAPDAWITFDPLGDLASEFTSGEPVASSELIAVAKSDRSAAASGTCSTDGFWKCVGGQAGQAWTALGGDASWNKVLLGFADPTESAVGALALGSAAASYFGSTSFGSTEIDSDDGFFTWYSAVAKSVPDDALADPVALLLQRPSKVGVAAGTAQHYAALAGSRTDAFPATYPGPMATADVVITVRDGVELPDSLAERLTGLLRDAGWNATPATGGLPSARALVRLTGLWEDVRS